MPTVEPDQLFVDPRDELTDEAMLEEMYYSMLSRHKLYILDQTKGTDIYGDPASQPVYSTEIEMPFLVKLNPEEQILFKYGFDRKRDAIVWMSRKICHDLGVLPKIGDRFDFTYRTAIGAVANEHFILNEAAPSDFQRQLVDHYQYVFAAERTQKKYRSPSGTPPTPKQLPFDVTLLRNM